MITFLQNNINSRDCLSFQKYFFSCVILVLWALSISTFQHIILFCRCIQKVQAKMFSLLQYSFICLLGLPFQCQISSRNFCPSAPPFISRPHLEIQEHSQTWSDVGISCFCTPTLSTSTISGHQNIAQVSHTHTHIPSWPLERKKGSPGLNNKILFL